MNKALQYSLVRYQPHVTRHEVVNIGVVLFTPQGPELHLASQLNKLTALDPNLSLQQVHDQVESMRETLTLLHRSGMEPEQATAFLSKGMAGPSCMPCGMLDPEGRSLDDLAQELLQELVLPPTRKRVTVSKTSSSRLHTELRQLFQRAGMLGKEPSDIARHKVVPHFPIDPDVGLFAEFALRNGRLHVTETVDFTVKDVAAKKREAESKTLVLLQALETVGQSDLRRHVVVSGAQVKAAQASIALLSRHADDVFVRESQADWRRYMDLMSEAAQHREVAA
ncbi:MAG: hypothetical protein RL268_82 [Pseudomonadota bacterium]|jgi:hypothetical protein